VSATTVILSPPEKLVLEVRATGHYFSLRWNLQSVTADVSLNDALVHFDEMYMKDRTSMDDLGIYVVNAHPWPNSAQETPTSVEFVDNLLLVCSIH